MARHFLVKQCAVIAYMQGCRSQVINAMRRSGRRFSTLSRIALTRFGPRAWQDWTRPAKRFAGAHVKISDMLELPAPKPPPCRTRVRSSMRPVRAMFPILSPWRTRRLAKRQGQASPVLGNRKLNRFTFRCAAALQRLIASEVRPAVSLGSELNLTWGRQPKTFLGEGIGGLYGV